MYLYMKVYFEVQMINVCVEQTYLCLISMLTCTDVN